MFIINGKIHVLIMLTEMAAALVGLICTLQWYQLHHCIVH
jgi:hypothetical protein